MEAMEGIASVYWSQRTMRASSPNCATCCVMFRIRSCRSPMSASKSMWTKRGETLEENAALKATTYARLAGLPTLADDSGLEVDALGGEPGVHSARYAGSNATDADRIAKLLDNLAVRTQPWTARFRCVIAIAIPDGDIELHSGACEGVIISKPRGDNGFGYDPVFLLLERGKTMAELSDAEKNDVSHRGAAARKAAHALIAGADMDELDDRMHSYLHIPYIDNGS